MQLRTLGVQQTLLTKDVRGRAVAVLYLGRSYEGLYKSNIFAMRRVSDKVAAVKKASG